jgi:hypothetical protein
MSILRPCRLVIALACLPAGCTNLHVMSTVPLSTVSRLSSLTAADIDVSLLRVAARLQVSLLPGSRCPIVTIVPPAVRNQMALDETILLEAVTKAHELDAVPERARVGEGLWALKLAPRDIERFRLAIVTIVEGAARPGVTRSGRRSRTPSSPKASAFSLAAEKRAGASKVAERSPDARFVPSCVPRSICERDSARRYPIQTTSCRVN